MRKRFFLKFFPTVAWAILATAAADAAPDRIAFPHSGVRLFAADAAAQWNAGVEIDLADGWKTYWRIPGESGVPPTFDWSGSTNVKSVTVGWPAPARMTDETGETIGYADVVVFPLKVEPADPSRPATLALALTYAACEKICVPASAELSVDVVPGAASAEPDAVRLRDFAARVPVKPAPGAVPAVASLALETDGEKPVLKVALNGNLPPAETDIFVEGDALSYFRKPRPEPGAAASAFRLPVDGIGDKAALRGKALTVTLVSGTLRLEQTLTVE
jgi:DsbC/DsbD-like thiol-disulfide interchange protein